MKCCYHIKGCKNQAEPEHKSCFSCREKQKRWYNHFERTNTIPWNLQWLVDCGVLVGKYSEGSWS